MTTDPREQEILRLASKLREVTEQRDRLLAWQAATEQGAPKVNSLRTAQQKLSENIRKWPKDDSEAMLNHTTAEQRVGESSFYVSKSVIEKCETTAYFSVFVYSEPQYATNPDDLIRVYTHPPKPTGGGVPGNFVLMPVALTAENGAKSALMGEFSESITLPCPDCEIYDTDQGDEHCPVCGDSGEIEQKVTVSWSTIKDIYAAAVSLLATQQPLEQDNQPKDMPEATRQHTPNVSRAGGNK